MNDTRKVRVKVKRKSPVGKKVPASRSPERLIERALGGEEETVIGPSLKDNEALVMIDYLAGIQQEIADLTEQLTSGKLMVKAYCKKNDAVEVATDNNVAKCGKSTKTEYGTATEMVKILKLEDKINLANDILSVKVGEAKNYLGEAVLKEHGFIGDSNTTDFATISIKGLTRKRR